MDPNGSRNSVIEYYYYYYRYKLVLEDNISNIILLKLKSLSSLILIDIVLAFPLLVRAYFLTFSSSFKTCRTIADYISDISTLEP
jgi:hypothetical protein